MSADGGALTIAPDDISGKPGFIIASGDSGFMVELCRSEPGFVCVDLGPGKPYLFSVPVNIEARFPKAMMESEFQSNPEKLKMAEWIIGGFEFHLEPIFLYPHSDTEVWQDIGFLGRKVRAIQIVVYHEGKVDRMHPEGRFLYNPQIGVLAFDYPYGKVGGGVEFRSYWLEGRCGLIPIAACREKNSQ